MKNHQNIKIRLANESDAGDILEIYRPYILNTCVSFESDIPTPEAFWSRIENILQSLPWLVCEYGSQIAGYAYAADHRSRKAYQSTKEVSVYIHDHFKRKGIATALYTTLIQLLKIQGVTNCLAGIALPNEASIRLHKKLGFRKIGIYHQVGFKFDAFRDVSWWELFIGEKNENPTGIIPVGAIKSSIEFDLAVKMGLKYLY